MKIAQLVEVLELLAKSSLLFENDKDAADLKAIASALKRNQRQTCKVQEASTFWRDSASSADERAGADSMTARELSNHLRLVSRLAKPFSKRNGLDTLQHLSETLASNGDVPALEVVSSKVSPRPQKDWLIELKKAGTNRKTFNETIEKMKSDKAVDLKALLDIMVAYTGNPRKTRSKKEAVERIVDRFEADAQFETKSRTIDRLTGNHKD